MKFYHLIKKIISLLIGVLGMYTIFTSSDPTEGAFQFIAWGGVLAIVNMLFAFGRMIASGSIVDKEWKPKMKFEPEALARMQKTRAVLQLILAIIALATTTLIVIATDLIFHGEITLPVSLFV